jgi:mannose-6-phosphate isomerase-like protein (cupin superfamily)
MKLMKWSEGDTYEGPGHFGVWGIHKVLAGRETQNMTINISQFIPEGGATMGGGPTEKYYHVLGGVLIVKDKAGKEYRLEKNDGIFIGAGEEREMFVPGPDPCTLFVVISAPCK